ncbi:MAG: biotin carboxylase N-terminal domain-containing protein [Methylococcaceae bacterium]
MKTFEKIMIANRGEIALRVIHAAQKLGIHSLAVYAEDDAGSLAVGMADEAILLPGNSLKDTYLNQEKIIRIALEHHAQAIHPGYGFLAENADFAQKVTEAGLTFIGPTPENIRLMGDKNQSLSYVHSLGIPILPSLRGRRDKLIKQVSEIDFPVIVKASGGGGGKGMVICYSIEELIPALESAERQALAWFGNGELFIEKYLPKARHVEVQLLADHFGKVLHFYERECSLQRHFQKVVEEAPSPSVHPQLRKDLTATAIQIARSMHYRNAGTIEFLLDEAGKYYFLEMNTRIQVEHPVTEMITHTDLVALQLQVAAGNPLLVEQDDIPLLGHAIEVRLCAEDASRNFLPSAGKITGWHIPKDEKVRIETFAAQGTTISAGYDSLLAKMIVHDKDRKSAIYKMQKVLTQSLIAGVHTNLSFLLELISSTVFERNKIYTGYIDQNLQAINTSILAKREKTDRHLLILAYLVFHFRQMKTPDHTVWQQIGYWRISQQMMVIVEGVDYNCQIENHETTCGYKINGKEYRPAAWEISDNQLQITLDGKTHLLYCVEEKDHTIIGHEGQLFELRSNVEIKQALEKGIYQQQVKHFQNLIRAELFGRVLKLSVVEGEIAQPNQVLLTLESMKTEIHVLSPAQGRVKKIHVKPGHTVAEKQLLIEMEAVGERTDGLKD